jgi:hypothetical protein
MIAGAVAAYRGRGPVPMLLIAVIAALLFAGAYAAVRVTP